MKLPVRISVIMNDDASKYTPDPGMAFLKNVMNKEKKNAVSVPRDISMWIKAVHLK